MFPEVKVRRFLRKPVELSAIMKTVNELVSKTARSRLSSVRLAHAIASASQAPAAHWFEVFVSTLAWLERRLARIGRHDPATHVVEGVASLRREGGGR